MPADPILRQHFQQGFTLLEVLMVVLLVGVLSSVVMISLGAGGEERGLKEESDRLAVLVEQAAMEAVMQSQEMGLRLTGDGYTFLCLDEQKQQWGECADSIFRARVLPEHLELRLVQAADLRGLQTEEEKPRREDEDEGRRETPDIFLLSSGEASPASLEIRVREEPELRSELRIDTLGRVERLGEDTPALPGAPAHAG